MIAKLCSSPFFFVFAMLTIQTKTMFVEADVRAQFLKYANTAALNIIKEHFEKY